MTKPNMRRGVDKYLDGKILFEYYWTKMGTARSYASLIRYCVAEGMVNSFTGMPPSRMGIFKSMWRWATLKENFEYGYELVNGVMRDEGRFMSKEEWKEFLVDKIRACYQYDPPRMKRFLKKNGYDI